MRDLILEQKTGFETSLPFVIYDNKGNIFYSSEFTDHISNGRVLKFNMPVGNYTYNGSFRKLSSPIKISTEPLPAKERKITKKTYKIIFDENPNKCSIYYKRGIILFDTQFKDAPLYVKYGIYFHELGHHYYKTEWKADMYAMRKMLEYGFNPSQIGRVGLEALGQNNFARKEKMINSLTKNIG